MPPPLPVGAVEAVLAALPIFADKSVKEPIKGPLIAAWLKSHRKKHMLKMKEYYMLLDVYNEEMSQLQSILAARRAMGATPSPAAATLNSLATAAMPLSPRPILSILR